MDAAEPNAKTLEAIREVESGNAIVCDTMDDYLKLVGNDIQD